MNKLDEIALIAGRILLGLYFVLPGIAKFVDWQSHIDLMQHHNAVSYTHLTLPTT